MRQLLSTLDTFWFAPESASRLAILRIVVGVAALCYLGPRFGYFSEIAGSPASLMGGMLLANVAFILGWRFQFTGPLMAHRHLRNGSPLAQATPNAAKFTARSSLGLNARGR